jgi:hypothetical protein
MRSIVHDAQSPLSQITKPPVFCDVFQLRYKTGWLSAIVANRPYCQPHPDHLAVTPNVALMQRSALGGLYAPAFFPNLHLANDAPGSQPPTVQCHHRQTCPGGIEKRLDGDLGEAFQARMTWHLLKTRNDFTIKYSSRHNVSDTLNLSPPWRWPRALLRSWHEQGCLNPMTNIRRYIK